MKNKVEELLIGVDNERKRAQLRLCTVDELDEFITRCPNDSLRSDAMNERQKRMLTALSQPRWIDWAILIVGIIAATAGVATLFR